MKARISAVAIAAFVLLAAVIVLSLKEHPENQNPSSQFWAMINQSMQTRSFSVSRSYKGENVSRSDIASVVLSPKPLINVRSTFSLSESSQSTYTQATEAIGTVSSEAFQIVNIGSSDINGNPLSNSAAKGAWVNISQSALDAGQLLLGALGGTNTSLAPLFFSDLDLTQRTILIRQMQSEHVYNISLARTGREGNGDLTYVYNVRVQSSAYQNVLESFVKEVDPSVVATNTERSTLSQKAANYSMTVDTVSHQLTESYGPCSLSLSGNCHLTFTQFNRVAAQGLIQPPATPDTLSQIANQLGTPGRPVVILSPLWAIGSILFL